MTDFDRDPEALTWARTKVQAYIDRLADFERQALADGNQAVVYGCSVGRLLAQRHFLGDGGCVIGAFDERLPGLLDGTIPPAPDGGPTVAECRDHDRRWDLERAGE